MKRNQIPDGQREDAEMMEKAEESEKRRESYSMENAKVQENRREDRRALKKLIVIIVLSAIGGGIVGGCSVRVSHASGGIADALLSLLSVIAPFGSLFITVLLLLWYGIVLRRLRKQFLLWDGEDEELINGIEDKLAWGMILAGVTNILNFFSLGAGFYAFDYFELDMYDIMTPVRLAALLGGALCAEAVITFLQKEIVNFTKEINPEKHGSVYDLKFRKIWIKNCDEAELAQSYKAGFFAFQMSGYTCMILVIFWFFGVLALDFGFAPLVMVMIIWLVQTVSYGVKCLSKNAQRQSE